MRAVGLHRHLLGGNGIDWGSGTGCLAIAAARVAGLAEVLGLELWPRNVAAARENARRNGVTHRATFYESDSYVPAAEAHRRRLQTLRGRIHFVLANPPFSDGDDGFEFRRRGLRGAQHYLLPGGVVFLSVSYQDGAQRVRRLTQEIAGFSYGGVLATTDWVPFDLQRPDLVVCLRDYVAEERRGGLSYEFWHAEAIAAELDARAALAHYERTGESPLTKWQVHLFRYVGDASGGPSGP